MKDNLQSYIALQLLEIWLNYVHEAADSVYIKNVYNAKVTEHFLGNEHFGADMTIPIEDRVDNAIKRVHKL